MKWMNGQWIKLNKWTEREEQVFFIVVGVWTTGMPTLVVCVCIDMLGRSPGQ